MLDTLITFLVSMFMLPTCTLPLHLVTLVSVFLYLFGTSLPLVFNVFTLIINLYYLLFIEYNKTHKNIYFVMGGFIDNFYPITISVKIKIVQ